MILTHTEQALYAAMQERRYSHGCCLVALQLLSGHKEAIREMLLYVTDGRPSEKRFTEKLGSVCEQYGIELTDR